MPVNTTLPSRKTLLLYCLIPAVACFMAARQAYLNKYYHLSTWKGGGMGMFAGADGGDTRFTRIFIETPEGARQPIVGLLPEQSRILEQALWYPAKPAFARLARSLRRTAFVASNEPSPTYAFNSKGERGENLGRNQYLLHARGPRPGGDDAAWTLVIEYWEISYDPSARLAAATLIDTMRYPKVTSQ